MKDMPIEVIERSNEIRDDVIKKLMYSIMYGQSASRIIIDITPEDLSSLSLRTRFKYSDEGKVNIVIESDTTNPDKWSVSIWDEKGVHGGLELYYSDIVNIMDKGIIVPCITIEYEDLDVPF